MKPGPIQTFDHRQRAEAVCDYFAGSLLVPKAWLKKAWFSGIQQLPDLADHFGVSRAAVQTRLFQTGLVDRPERCPKPSTGFRFYRPTTRSFENLREVTRPKLSQTL